MEYELTHDIVLLWVKQLDIGFALKWSFNLYPFCQVWCLVSKGRLKGTIPLNYTVALSHLSRPYDLYRAIDTVGKPYYVAQTNPGETGGN